MGSNKTWYVIIWVIFLRWSFSQASNMYNSASLDDFIHDYVNKSVPNPPRTGSLYNISLPANFSGMEVSVIRLRSGSFWTRGANYTSFQIPPRTLPTPFVTRLAIVYSILGNWSSSYYDLPGYSFVSPVVGFAMYDASSTSILGNIKLNLSIMGDPISVRFPQNLGLEENRNDLKCVRFGDDGSVEMVNMTSLNVCSVEGQGHFSIVVSSSNLPERKKERLLKWWILGFVGGFVALVLVGLIGILIYRFVRKKIMKDMEKQADQGVAFDTLWIGESKMPSATMTRTQPSLETEYVP